MKVFVANRGECAVRIARSCKRMGIASSCAFTPGDTSHIGAFEESFPLNTNYLDIEEIIKLAGNADAIHPGWGFLSENSAFATAVEKAGITFIGPSPKTLSLCASKAKARELAQSAGIPIIQGGDNPLKVGFPLMIKAAMGGGGRGMRVVKEQSELESALSSAKREALSAFGDDTLIFEQLLYPARHIEVQLLGDKKGNLFHLFDRECSLQRRNQKVIEEAPAANNPLSAEMLEAALKIGKALKLSNAATVEFLVSENKFYFLEVNPRLQVEHPVTEAITGLDLVELQILAAQGQELKLANLKVNGHAIEARVSAENPSNNFMPAVGKLEFPVLPENVRVDHAITPGMEVGSNFDSMLAKVICHAPSRKDSIAKLQHALGSTQLVGLTTNVQFLRHLVSRPEVNNFSFHTKFIEESLDHLCPNLNELALAAHLGSEFTRYHGAFWDLPYWRTTELCSPQIKVTLNEEEYTAKLLSFEQTTPDIWLVSMRINGSVQEYKFSRQGEFLCLNDKFLFYILKSCDDYNCLWLANQVYRIERISESNSASLNSGTRITSPLPGSVLEIRKAVGDRVSKGETIVVLDSMKIEHPITASVDAEISEVLVSTAEVVDEGQVLITLVIE